MSYLYTQVSAGDFSDLFRQCGRESQFSYRAKSALFEYLNDLALDLNEPLEIDAIALCCEWTEYASVTAAAQEYGYVAEADEDEDDDNKTLEYLTHRTTIVEFAGGVLVQGF